MLSVPMKGVYSQYQCSFVDMSGLVRKALQPGPSSHHVQAHSQDTHAVLHRSHRVCCRRYFEGLAAWQLWGAAGNLVQGRNRAGQTYDPVKRTVENYAEIGGPAVHVTARGTFQPLVRSAS